MSEDRLQRYRQKRDFAITSEPQGGRASGKALSFVIQKHAARRLHYDFRLELDGTLLSWAVPKGPSLDPADKRMAVHVEDHPLDYANFEGVIPPGQYGAGTVIVWDRGTWLPDGDPRAAYQAGKLKFELKGHKLSGHWTLVRMRGRGDEHQEPWLLIKERDAAARPSGEYSVVDALPDSVLKGVPSKKGEPASVKQAAANKAAASKKAAASPRAPKVRAAAQRATALPTGARRAELPLTLAPQLATLVDAPPKSGDWSYEIKFDGYRLLARIDGDEVRLFTRNGHDWTSKLKRLAREVQALGFQNAWLDGEIVVQGDSGAPDFQRLQNAFDAARTDAIQFFVFDLPYCDGHDLRTVPLRERRALLRERLAAATRSPRVHFSEDFEVTAADLLHTACQMQMEGVIGKRTDAPYSSGRSSSWVKLKCTQRQEFVVGGFTAPKGSRTGFGALMLGVHDEAGRLRYAGNCGTGFSEQSLTRLSEKFAQLQTPTCPFEPKPPSNVKGQWLKPRLMAEVSFAEWTQSGHVRQAVFHGLRGDKPPKAVTVEKPKPAPGADGAKGRPRTPSLGALKLTHGDRVIDPSTGFTKRELAEYYARVAARMLPHLKNRPVSLVRAPDGIAGELFFQKHAQRMKFPGITQLPAELDRDHDPLLAVQTREALLGCVQMNVIELHTWNATVTRIEQPDRMTFDLDPGEGVAWARMQEAATLVRALLEELQLDALLKTSGGKGLHVVVPFAPQWGWDVVKSFSQAVVVHLAQTLPQLFVSKSGPKNRVGRIFVDYLRNGRGATTVSAWSARARPGMGVSIPVDWSELPMLRSGAHWTVHTADERLALDDPWGPKLKSRQTLTAAMRALDFVPPKRRAG